MDVDLRHLRCLIAVVDHGGFTGAAAELGVSQPSVTRGIAALERSLEVRLLRRSSREVAPTAAGVRVLQRARRLLSDVDDLIRDARSGSGIVRVGHAWAAIGAHTVIFQQRWAREHPDIELHLVRTNSPTGGLAERACDIAVVRTAEESPVTTDPRFANVIVGLESRYCATATGHPLARRRQLRLTDLAEYVLAVDPRTGTTTPELWPTDHTPAIEVIHELDDWLDVIASGRCIGVTTEATTTQYRRRGITFRRLRDAPSVAVRLLWWHDDVHPAAPKVVGLLTELYRPPATPRLL
jgi:DNA-binding transcriptional LysR family regulator